MLHIKTHFFLPPAPNNIDNIIKLFFFFSPASSLIYHHSYTYTQNNNEAKNIQKIFLVFFSFLFLFNAILWHFILFFRLQHYLLVDIKSHTCCVRFVAIFLFRYCQHKDINTHICRNK